MYTLSTEESAFRSKGKGFLLLKPVRNEPRGLKFIVPFKPVEEVICKHTKIFKLLSDEDHAEWYIKSEKWQAEQSILREKALAKLTDVDLKVLGIRR